jgi:triosephosphate isomerase
MTTKIPWIIGTSWKMNKLRVDAVAFSNAVKASSVAQTYAVQPFVIPPFSYIADVADLLKGTRVKIGAQNMHWGMTAHGPAKPRPP